MVISAFDEMVIVEVETLEYAQKETEEDEMDEWTDIGEEPRGAYSSPPPSRMRRQPQTYGSAGSGPEIDAEADDILQFRKTNDDDGDDDGGGQGEGIMGGHGGDKGGDKRDGGESRLVDPRSVIISVFTGRNLVINPYMVFHNAVRRLILIKGRDGDIVVDILDRVESMAAAVSIESCHKSLKSKCLRSWNMAEQYRPHCSITQQVLLKV